MSGAMFRCIASKFGSKKIKRKGEVDERTGSKHKIAERGQFGFVFLGAKPRTKRLRAREEEKLE
jgi:hypothetical protein